MDFKGKTVAVTGACGTVGKALTDLLVSQGCKSVVAIDNNESDLFHLSEKYGEDRVNAVFCDIRDLRSVTRAFAGVNTVFHAAALKHVIMMERSPNEAIQTNITGTENVIEAAFANDVERVLFTSSDKAVNPSSVMGTSKLFGEKLMLAADQRAGENGPVFASTRFGNVLGSRGSVLTIFAKQIEEGKPLTLTHEHMTRFIMSIEQASELVVRSALIAKGGELFITKMPVVNIKDLGYAMCDLLAPKEALYQSDKGFKIIGSKPGEKLYEELCTAEEACRMRDDGDYYVIDPLGKATLAEASSEDIAAYNSANVPGMHRQQIAKYLEKWKLVTPSEALRSVGDADMGKIKAA